MTGWIVVIPVKAIGLAKSRLAGDVAPETRAALARAFALDTIETAAACPVVEQVVVVGDELELGALLAGRAEVVDEGPRTGLTAAIRRGIDHARAAGPVPIAVLLGDLPALTSEALEAGLAAAARHPLAFVPDLDGMGTTLATAGAGQPFEPAFGDGSAARHAAAGFIDLTLAEPGSIGTGLRRDVDTIAALEAALVEGVGVYTAAVVAGLADGSLPHDHPNQVRNRKGTP